MSKLHEEAAKGWKSPEESYSKPQGYHSESSKEDETRRPLYPVLDSYRNTCATDADGSCTIRFDDIGQEAELYYFVPPGLREDIMGAKTCSFESKNYGFATFRTPQIARRFLHEFNGLKIPGTNLTYKLSWAPFGHDRYFDNDFVAVDVPEEKSANDVPGKKNVEQANVREALVGGEDTVTGINNSFDSFYISLHEKAHEEKRAFWSWPLPEAIYYPQEDDGLTTVMLLFNVDPAIKGNQIKDLIGCYKECTVDIYDDAGFGIVKFEDRRLAKEAYEKAISENKGLFQCTWGFKKEPAKDSHYVLDRVGRHVLEVFEGFVYRKMQYHPYCHLLGRDCRSEHELLPLRMSKSYYLTSLL